MTRTAQNGLASKTASVLKKPAAKRKAPKTNVPEAQSGHTLSKAPRHLSAGHESQPALGSATGSFFDSGVFCFFPRCQ